MRRPGATASWRAWPAPALPSDRCSVPASASLWIPAPRSSLCSIAPEPDPSRWRSRATTPTRRPAPTDRRQILLLRPMPASRRAGDDKCGLATQRTSHSVRRAQPHAHERVPLPTGIGQLAPSALSGARQSNLDVQPLEVFVAVAAPTDRASAGAAAARAPDQAAVRQHMSGRCPTDACAESAYAPRDQGRPRSSPEQSRLPIPLLFIRWRRCARSQPGAT